MNTCGRLFLANQVYAYFSAAEKRVVVAADVTMNPAADEVHLCPNPIAVPPSREFLVEGTTRPGIHPQLAVVRRVSYSFASDLTPKSVIVYSAGIDGPVRQEVPVASPPPPIVHSPHEDAAARHRGVEVVGYSPSFSLEQAVQDALAKAAEQRPGPPRNPDAAVEIDITDISARTGGNIRPGLFVRATAK